MGFVLKRPTNLLKKNRHVVTTAGIPRIGAPGREVPMEIMEMQMEGGGGLPLWAFL